METLYATTAAIIFVAIVAALVIGAHFILHNWMFSETIKTPTQEELQQLERAIDEANRQCQLATSPTQQEGASQVHEWLKELLDIKLQAYKARYPDVADPLHPNRIYFY